MVALNVKIRPQELKSKDHRTLLVAVLSQWLPLAPATFRAIVEVVPSPSKAQSVRIPKMLHPDLPYHQITAKAENKLEEDLYSGDTSSDAFVVAYISKMFAVPTADLPQNQRKPLTAEEMRERGRASREAAAVLAVIGPALLENAQQIDSNGNHEPENPAEVPTPAEATKEGEATESLLGFARLYSGIMRTGQTMYALLPKYKATLLPSHPRNQKYIIPVKIECLYMMMGRDLLPVIEVPAGNVFAISGLEGKILRNGSLCGLGTRDAARETADMDKDKGCLVNLAGLYMPVLESFSTSCYLNLMSAYSLLRLCELRWSQRNPVSVLPLV